MAREIGWWLDLKPSLPLVETTRDVRGGELFCRTGGQGPALLLLHGFLQTGQLWNPFLDALGEHYTLVVPDLPSHGRSLPLHTAFSFRENARAMFGLLDELGIGTVLGIGLSAGADTLIHMAIQQRCRVEGMVIAGGAHRLPVNARAGFRELYWDSLDANTRERLTRRHARGMPQVQQVLSLARGLADDYEDFDLSPEHLALIKAKTLLVFGDRDGTVPVEFALEMYRAIPKSALWVIPGKGHMAVWASEEAIATFPTVVHKFFQEELMG